MNLQKKIGPLPIWAWGLIAVAGYYFYRRYQANQSTSASSLGTTGILDPNAVDPNTGLTYGQEEAAAMNANAGSLAGSSSPGGSSAQGTVPSTNEFGDFLTFLDEWNQFAQASGWQPPGAGSSTGFAAANSPPVQGSSPPTSTPSANTGTPSTNQTGPPNYAAIDRPYLAPGATAPSYALVRPSGAPSNALWSGSRSPGTGWRGLGGGWWQPPAKDVHH